MQKKENFLDKIVIKNYNNELEEILEKKNFDENTKSLLLSILYKIETAYKDYEKVKQNVESKDEFIESLIRIIKDECDDIKIVKMHSEESKILGNKTFLVEKKSKRIICYPIERKLLYCISKIGKKEKIIKEDYYLLNKTLSELLNVGHSINTVEVMRDFNGYSWTTLPREIESISHNLIYQNLRILVGHNFLNNWIKNKEFIIDYFESFKNQLDEIYGEELEKELIELLNKISILISLKFNVKLKDDMLKSKSEIEEKMNLIKDNKNFVEKVTAEKRKLTEEIKILDETINNKALLQNEYKKRNEKLPLQEKIFSLRILSKLMEEEREERLKKIEELNELLNPQKYMEYRKKLEEKEACLRLVDTKNLEDEIENLLKLLQIAFLKCYKTKIEKVDTKQDLIKLIYEFRYYCLLPFNIDKNVLELEDIREEIEGVQKDLIDKAHEIKVLDIISKDKEFEYQILKEIFKVRVIDLENISIKITKEKDKFFIQIFDEEIFEEKIEISNMVNLDKKDLEIKFGKKIKIFT